MSRNIAWLLADNVLRMAISLVVGIWLARYLGPELFGRLNYALALVGMFTVVASLGVDGNIVKDLVREPQNGAQILGTTFGLKLCVAAVTIPLCICSAYWLTSPGSETFYLVVILSLSMLFLTTETITVWFQSQLQSKYVVIARNSAYFFGAFIRVGLILTQAPLLAFAWAALAEAVVVASALVFVYIKKQGFIFVQWRMRWSQGKRIITEGWPLLLSAISAVLYLRLDMLMLGEMVGDEAVGIYGAATRLSEVWYFLPMAIVASFQPALVEAHVAGGALYKRRLSQLYVLMASLSLSVSLIVTLVATPVVQLLYGSQYAEAGSVLALHVWASVAVFLGVASSQYLIIEGLQKLALYRTLLGLGFNIILNLVLIPYAGAVGAAFATLISYCVATFSLALFPSTRPQVFLMLRSLSPVLWLSLLKGRH